MWPPKRRRCRGSKGPLPARGSRPRARDEFGYANVMQGPRPEKAHPVTGRRRGGQGRDELIEARRRDLSTITGCGRPWPGEESVASSSCARACHIGAHTTMRGAPECGESSSTG